MRIVNRCFVLFALLVFSGVSLRAQTASSAVVSGRVVDESGGVVPDAQVTLRNTATNATRNQTTSAEGQYVFSDVPPGTYTLSVSKTGFQTTNITSQTFNINESYTQNITLRVGQTSQTVTVSEQAPLQLQTSDATIGNVIAGQEMTHLPTQLHDATELLQLQPGATPVPIQNVAGPTQDVFGSSGGGVAGSRADQNADSLDGVDVSVHAYHSLDSNPVFPLGVDTISEFRVGITNPNATFGSGGGAEVAVASKSGSDAFHGVGYWYDQNTVFNANEWDNKNTIDTATGKALPRPPIRDNRVGLAFGGPIQKDKTFFFTNYEVRRYAQSIRNISQVPSADLRGDNPLYPNGAITEGGTTYDLKAIDPRGLGLSPAVRALWKLMPTGNDPSAGADGCVNFCGYLSNIPADRKDDAISYRLDHSFTQNLHFFGRYEYSRDINANSQVDLVPAASGGAAKYAGSVSARGDGASTGLDWIIRPTLINSVRFGWIRSRLASDAVPGNVFSAAYNIPGTNSIYGPVTLEPDFSSSSSPLNFNLPTDSTSAWEVDSTNWQIRNDLNWTKGTHTLAFGGAFSYIPIYHRDSQRIQGPQNYVSAVLDANNFGFLSLPLTYGDGSTAFARLFAAELGLVDSTSIMIPRDRNLNALPAGSPITRNTTLGSHYFYAQDTWRMRPSITLSYGLTYGWQTPPRVQGGEAMVLVDSTGKPFDSAAYIATRRADALKGIIYNPSFYHLPYTQLGMSGSWNTDWTNIGPRVSLAWSPSGKGFLGNILGNQKTVIRMGYGLVYDRINYLTPMLANLGFSQNLTLPTPLCNATGTPATGCNAAATDPVLSSFRIGVDGSIPVPAVPTATLPYASSPAAPEFWDYEVDPNLKVGQIHNVDLSIQRQLSGNNFIEVGYIGRLARNLGNAVELVEPPYMFVDTASGQSFAQAYDCVAQVLRGLTPPSSKFPCTSGGNMVAQPWFENQVPAAYAATNCGGGTITQCLATQQGGNFVTGNIAEFGGVFGTIDGARIAAGLQPFVNQQQTDLEVRQSDDFSDYHALTVTWRNSSWKGLTFDFDYTFSKLMDNGGRIGIFANGYDDSFNPEAGHGPAYFDRTHTFNATYDYELPVGRGRFLGGNMGTGWNRLFGGWYTAGIFTAASGLPECATESAAYGGGVISGNPICEIPTNYAALQTGLHHNVFSSTAPCNFQNAGANTTVFGTPAAQGGTGLNLFADPGATACAFRPILLSQDLRNGRDSAIRGLGTWNLDMQVGKDTAITDRVRVNLSVDIFNVFNHVNFVDAGVGQYQGGMDLTGGSNGAFGVISSQAIPGDRIAGSRWMEFGLRLSF